MDVQVMVSLLQIFLMLTVLYFVVKRQPGGTRSLPQASVKNSDKELEKLRRLREDTLSAPLSEKTRPACFDDIVGQAEGIRALQAALCGANPQHVLIYGPPGIGKTCAARLVLECAKSSRGTPFKKDAKFVEVDATCVRFDERAIADPLVGSVHDPIYQGAGALGNAGIPQPKPGAVTKASGGVLFLDEIGELHPVQMNKLLKVLEDRYVLFESSYYSADDPAIPPYIHDVFKNGMPADFRLVGATTRQPSELPEAIRSRCIEIFFKPLKSAELAQIATMAALKTELSMEEGVARRIARYSSSGREVANIVQLAAGLAMQEGRKEILAADIEWVAATCRCKARVERRVPKEPQPGTANGLAVLGDGTGVLLEIEALAQPTDAGRGTLTVTGIVEEEELNSGERKLRRKSTACGSVENVLTALKLTMGLDFRDYDIHINFPGGVPVDGPSAGIAIATAVASAILDRPTDCTLAMTGEVTIRGMVKPVGGVRAKLEAAAASGAVRALIPDDNSAEKKAPDGLEVIPVKTLAQVLEYAFGKKEDSLETGGSLLIAQPADA